MKKLLKLTCTTLPAFLIMLISASASAQNVDTLRTGGISVYYDRLGVIKVTSPGFVRSEEIRQVDRISLLAGLNKDYTYDYNEDSDVLSPNQRIQFRDLPQTTTSLYNNGYSLKWPHISVRQMVTGYTDSQHILTSLWIRNDSTAAVELDLGLFVATKPSNSYSDNAVKYDTLSKAAYSYQDNGNEFVALAFMNMDPTGLSVLDWADYTPDNLDEDASNDSIRYSMVSAEGFPEDEVLIANSNGAVYSLNAGKVIIEAGDSTEIIAAVIFTTEEDEIPGLVDLARADYDRVFYGLGTAQLNTEAITIELTQYGRIRVLSPALVRQMDRISLMAGLDEDYVFDQAEDFEVVSPVFPFLKVEDVTGYETIYDNYYSQKWPNLTAFHEIWGYNGDSYVFSQMKIRNDSTQAVNLRLGIFGATKPSNSYDDNVVAWEDNSEAIYSYQKSNSEFTFVALLNRAVSGVVSLDWTDYSPSFDGDEAIDSVRFSMLNQTGVSVDEYLNSNGAVYSLNAGEVTIEPGSSINFDVVIGFTTEENEIESLVDEAKAKYNTVVSVSDPVQVTETFTLYQNYPNPFNPSTTIRFLITEAQPVELTVYNLLGQKVATLVNGTLTPQTYEINFNGSGLVSGLYFYRLVAGNSSSVKRMMLIK